MKKKAYAVDLSGYDEDIDEEKEKSERDYFEDE